MSSKFSENVEAQIVGTIIGGVILLAPAAIFAGAAPLLSALFGERITYLLELILGSVALLFTVLAGHYYFLILPLAEKNAGSAEREPYDRLKSDLATGGTAARVYSDRLTAVLAFVDKFVGDRGIRQFGFLLKTPAPIWTAASFHWCLLVAVAYPLVMIFLIWVFSGEVGPAEAMLGLPPFLSTWKRGLTLLALVISVSAYRASYQSTGWRIASFLALAVFAGSIVAITVAGAGSAAVAGAVAVTGGVVGVLAGDFRVVAIATGMGALAGAVASGIAGSITGAIAGFSVAAISGLAAKGRIDVERYPLKGAFWLVFVVTTVIACLAAAEMLSGMRSWLVVGPLLLFVGLLTLLNAPFTWFSVGLTRLLLRRGLERQSWWPYFYALVDACCAVIVIVLLACTMVVGIQSFDFMAIQGHGTKVLPLDELFQSIQADPLAPQFWWIYALFLATMVPSLANLIIGGLSLTRGIPRLSMRIHGLMYDGKAMSDAERARIASLLAGQVVIGALLGVAGQAALAIIIFQYAMPFLGVELLDLAQVIAGLNIPLRLHDLLF